MRRFVPGGIDDPGFDGEISIDERIDRSVGECPPASHRCARGDRFTCRRVGVRRRSAIGHLYIQCSGLVARAVIRNRDLEIGERCLECRVDAIGGVACRAEIGGYSRCADDRGSGYCIVNRIGCLSRGGCIGISRPIPCRDRNDMRSIVSCRNVPRVRPVQVVGLRHGGGRHQRANGDRRHRRLIDLVVFGECRRDHDRVCINHERVGMIIRQNDGRHLRIQGMSLRHCCMRRTVAGDIDNPGLDTQITVDEGIDGTSSECPPVRGSRPRRDRATSRRVRMRRACAVQESHIQVSSLVARAIVGDGHLEIPKGRFERCIHVVGQVACSPEVGGYRRCTDDGLSRCRIVDRIGGLAGRGVIFISGPVKSPDGNGIRAVVAGRNIPRVGPVQVIDLRHGVIDLEGADGDGRRGRFIDHVVFGERCGDQNRVGIANDTVRMVVRQDDGRRRHIRSFDQPGRQGDIPREIRHIGIDVVHPCRVAGTTGYLQNSISTAPDIGGGSETQRRQSRFHGRSACGGNGFTENEICRRPIGNDDNRRPGQPRNGREGVVDRIGRLAGRCGISIARPVFRGDRNGLRSVVAGRNIPRVGPVQVVDLRHVRIGDQRANGDLGHGGFVDLVGFGKRGRDDDRVGIANDRVGVVIRQGDGRRDRIQPIGFRHGLMRGFVPCGVDDPGLDTEIAVDEGVDGTDDECSPVRSSHSGRDRVAGRRIAGRCGGTVEKPDIQRTGLVPDAVVGDGHLEIVERSLESRVHMIPKIGRSTEIGRNGGCADDRRCRRRIVYRIGRFAGRCGVHVAGGIMGSDRNRMHPIAAGRHIPREGPVQVVGLRHHPIGDDRSDRDGRRHGFVDLVGLGERCRDNHRVGIPHDRIGVIVRQDNGRHRIVEKI